MLWRVCSCTGHRSNRMHNRIGSWSILICCLNDNCVRGVRFNEVRYGRVFSAFVEISANDMVSHPFRAKNLLIIIVLKFLLLTMALMELGQS